MRLLSQLGLIQCHNEQLLWSNHHPLVNRVESQIQSHKSIIDIVTRFISEFCNLFDLQQKK